MRIPYTQLHGRQNVGRSTCQLCQKGRVRFQPCMLVLGLKFDPWGSLHCFPPNLGSTCQWRRRCSSLCTNWSCKGSTSRSKHHDQYTTMHHAASLSTMYCKYITADQNIENRNIKVEKNLSGWSSPVELFRHFCMFQHLKPSQRTTSCHLPRLYFHPYTQQSSNCNVQHSNRPSWWR
jgi:hypothetical protein